MFKGIGSRSNALKNVTLLFLLLSGTLSIFKAYRLFVIFRKTAYLYHGHIFFRGFLKFHFLPHTHPLGQAGGRKMYRLVCTSTLVKSRNRLRCLPPLSRRRAHFAFSALHTRLFCLLVLTTPMATATHYTWPFPHVNC